MFYTVGCGTPFTGKLVLDEDGKAATMVDNTFCYCLYPSPIPWNPTRTRLHTAPPAQRQTPVPHIGPICSSPDDSHIIWLGTPEMKE